MSKSSQEISGSYRRSLSFPSRRAFVRGLGLTMTLPLASRLLAQTAKPARTFKNPLKCVIGDPYVLKAPDGRYYIYGTGGGGFLGAPPAGSGTVHVGNSGNAVGGPVGSSGGPVGVVRDVTTAFPTFTSPNLVDWTEVGQTYKRDPENSWCVGAFWAPEVYHVKGRYYMFYSAQWRNNPTNEKENFRIGVAVSDKPTGPFKDIQNKPLFDPGYPAIDADVLFDDSGKVYLYYSRCCYKHPVESELAEKMKKEGVYEQIEESWVYGVEIKSDFSGIIGEPVVMIRPPEKLDDPNSEWEDVSVDTHEVGRRWVEGPCSFKKYGTYFIMYSANTVAGENYALGYATAKHPLGPFVKASNNPVARKNTDRGGNVSCTAHACVAMSPDDTEMFCLYGGKIKGETRFRRILFLNRMEVQKNGTLIVYPPDTITENPMPSGSVA